MAKQKTSGSAKTTLPFCSILVLNYNGRKYADDCFGSLKEINYPKEGYEVVMIDNASTDGSVQYVKKKFPWVKHIHNDKNYGFGEGYNKGIEKVEADYYIILNNDTQVEEEWLMELVKVAQIDDKIGICGSRIVDEKIGEVGEGHINLLGIPVQRNSPTPKECFWISDCSMLIKNELVEKMGKVYDPDYFMYFEEIDVGWRAHLLGYKVVYVPGSAVRHLGAATASGMGNIMHYHHYRNKIWTFKKNSRFPLTQFFMISIAVTTLLMISYLSVKKKWGYGISVLKYIFSKKEKTPDIYKTSLKDQLKMFLL